MSNRRRGDFGEDDACGFLIRKGYEILERNYVVRGVGEIDIIARDGDEIVFVEVKRRLSDRYGAPEDAITAKKRGNIARAAQRWLIARGMEDAFARFDVVVLTATGIGHEADAFDASDVEGI